VEHHYSLLYSLVNDLPIEKGYYSKFYPHPGYGWGITRLSFDRIGGLIDWEIIGSGDSHMAFSFLLRHRESLPFSHNEFSEGYLRKIYEWQEKVRFLYEEKKFGYADVVINHHFHGYREDRQYVDRLRLLTESSYNPLNDLYYNEHGVIQLKESCSELQERIKTYFIKRKEDKKNREIDDIVVDITYRPPEELLQDAKFLKIFLEGESFKQIKKSLSNKKVKRSNSSDSHERQMIVPKKRVEMNVSNDDSTEKESNSSFSPQYHNVSYDDTVVVTTYGNGCSSGKIPRRPAIHY